MRAGLVDHIDGKGMPADVFQGSAQASSPGAQKKHGRLRCSFAIFRNGFRHIFNRPALFFSAEAAEGEEAAPEQEDPGKQGEIVRRKEAGPGKAQDHRENAMIQKIRKSEKAQPFKAEPPRGYVPGQEEKKQAAGQAA